MAVVITVAQQKGGTGKTTLAANIAAALAPSQRVALLDIDPQKSLGRWHALRIARPRQAVALTFSDTSGWRLPAELERLKRSHDVVLIDSPPHLDTDAQVAVRAADIVLVPIQPSLPDIWAAEGTLKLAADERRPAHLMFNRTPPISKLRDAIAADLAARGSRCCARHLATAPASRMPSPPVSASPRPRRAPPPPRSCARCSMNCGS